MVVVNPTTVVAAMVVGIHRAAEEVEVAGNRPTANSPLHGTYDNGYGISMSDSDMREHTDRLVQHPGFTATRLSGGFPRNNTTNTTFP